MPTSYGLRTPALLPVADPAPSHLQGDEHIFGPSAYGHVQGLQQGHLLLGDYPLDGCHLCVHAGGPLEVLGVRGLVSSPLERGAYRCHRERVPVEDGAKRPEKRFAICPVDSEDPRHIAAGAGETFGRVRHWQHTTEAGNGESDLVAAEIGPEMTGAIGELWFVCHGEPRRPRAEVQPDEDRHFLATDRSVPTGPSDLEQVPFQPAASWAESQATASIRAI